MLGNLHPKQRSKLSSLYLVALVKHKVLQKYGMDSILKPFVHDMKKLVSIVPNTKSRIIIVIHVESSAQQEEGYTFTLQGGKKKKVFGALAAVSADNLGSLSLGGFKESCAAIKMCRQCMADHSTAKIKVGTFLTLVFEWIIDTSLWLLSVY